MKRVFLIVLDSFGIGALPDADHFGDAGCNTLRSCAGTGMLDIPNLQRLGLGSIDGVSCLPGATARESAYGRMTEQSLGKDTTTGHWEIAGLILKHPFPTYPQGFPEKLLTEFSRLTGRGILCNLPYSGTEVIARYGEEHQRTGDLIVYTSADSVFQIAAHEAVVPVETLYEYCRIARGLLQGEHGVGRVIARPFTGNAPDFIRTERRRDFSLAPTGQTMLDILAEAGRDVLAVGKITDIFTGRGITCSVEAHGNEEGMRATMQLCAKNFHGLCFTNLVDFDMLYGHRNDARGYAEALNRFDRWLGDFLRRLREEDLLMITADHGCDPGFPGTDHTREYTPLLLYGRGIHPHNLGTRPTFADIAQTVCTFLEVPFSGPGSSLI